MSEKKEKPSLEDLLFHIQTDIDELKGQVLQVTDFSLETRLTAIMSSHTLPLITTQFKRVIAEAYATRNSLVDVEKELAEKHASTEDLMRLSSRLSEKIGYTTRNFEAYLSRYKATVEQLAVKEARIRHLELEVQTQKDLISNVHEIMAAIREMASQKRLPADVVADLKTLLNEIPKPIPAAPEETRETPYGEEP